MSKNKDLVEVNSPSSL
jgi:hypothetical protein